MYSQCDNCQAIFRVTMKELTAAQGLLRCGECGSTFDAMKSLSTTLPEDRKFVKKTELEREVKETPSKPIKKRKIYLSSSDHTRTASSTSRQHPNQAYQLRKIQKNARSTRLLVIALISLSLLLLAQILYKQKDWLAEQPITAGVTRAFCKIAGCKIEVRRDISKIEMLNRNIYSHPNEPNSLVVTASLENKASFDQPFPLIEISLLNSKSEIVALRRFTPKEYLQNKYKKGMLMTSNKSIELKVHIADPGKDAVRFQFRFL